MDCDKNKQLTQQQIDTLLSAYQGNLDDTKIAKESDDDEEISFCNGYDRALTYVFDVLDIKYER